jgi:uncharacterized protein (TIGR03086 family)
VSETADRYRKVAAGFTERVGQVRPDAWDNSTPCEQWVARDIVRHVVEVAGSFLSRTTAAAPSGPSVEEDPLGAWTGARDAIQAALEDPEIAAQSTETPLGPSTLEQTVGMFVAGDTLIHTWDLARATGQDESLDPIEVGRMLAGMQQFDDSMLRQSGAFAPAVDVPADANEQTRLIAFTGRRP